MILDQIKEEKEFDVYKKTEVKRIREEMDKLEKKKCFYDKEFKSKMDNQKKTIQQLKTELKKKDDSIKDT